MKRIVRDLGNYHTLVTRVDELCAEITGQFGAAIACCPGCAGCCRHISIFPVEGIALAAALRNLPAVEASRIRELARLSPSDAPCPLLEEGRCLLYAARPIICRTHGLPLLTIQDEKRAVDFCPLNFQGVGSLPGHAVIDLDRLNTALTAVNALFVAEFPRGDLVGRGRLTIAESLLFEL